MHYVYSTPVFAMVRFENWDALLAAPPISDRHVYASLLWHFGRGMAFCGKNDLPEVTSELGIMERLLKDSALYQPFDPFSPAIHGATIAVQLLKGSMALRQNNYREAIRNFILAVEKEKAMVYNEPRDWLLNTEHFLANAYGSAGDWQKAEICFIEDLKVNNENVWSLAGLSKALQNQGKKMDAAKVHSRLKKAMSQGTAVGKAE
jgi:tetratricopeptide (TPR) repeat protein